MPDSSQRGGGTAARSDLPPIGVAWLMFSNNVRVLLVPQADDRPLDAFLPFRDRVYGIVQSPDFLKALDRSWAPFRNGPLRPIGEALIVELTDFSRSAEVAQATERPATESKGWWKRQLGRASTVTGSVNDLMENLPPQVKGGITLFKELIDLFKGDGD